MNPTAMKIAKTLLAASLVACALAFTISPSSLLAAVPLATFSPN